METTPTPTHAPAVAPHAVAPAPQLDIAQALAPVGGAVAPDQLARLAELARAAWEEAAPDRRAKLARMTEDRKGRPLDTVRAREAVTYLLALAAEGGNATRAARAVGRPLRELYGPVHDSLHLCPILLEVEEAARRRLNRRLVDAAGAVIDGVLDGEEVTRAQERIAPVVLERLARETWAPDRGGRADQQQARGAPAQVLINIQSGSAFNSCSTVLQSTDAEVVSV